MKSQVVHITEFGVRYTDVDGILPYRPSEEDRRGDKQWMYRPNVPASRLVIYRSISSMGIGVAHESWLMIRRYPFTVHPFVGIARNGTFPTSKDFSKTIVIVRA